VVSRIDRGLAALVVGAGLAFSLAAGSVVVRRPVQTVVGNVCEPTRDNPSGLCFQPLPAAGWPFAFYYDDPGTSVRGHLGVEDNFEPGWFLIDAAVFGALLAVSAVGFRMRRRRSSESIRT
jgi:ABC-type cobalamin transport system permease subunit